MSTLNQIQNNYITLSISTTNHSIKTIVIQNPWRLNLHCGDQINWTFETTEKKKIPTAKLNGRKKIVKFNCLKILSRNWPENWTKFQRSKTIFLSIGQFDRRLRLRKYILRSSVELCACAPTVSVSIFDINVRYGLK